MDTNLILGENRSSKIELFQVSHFDSRWLYKDVKYQHYKICEVTIMESENDRADRVCFNIILN